MEKTWTLTRGKLKGFSRCNSYIYIQAELHMKMRYWNKRVKSRGGDRTLFCASTLWVFVTWLTLFSLRCSDPDWAAPGSKRYLKTFSGSENSNITRTHDMSSCWQHGWKPYLWLVLSASPPMAGSWWFWSVSQPRDGRMGPESVECQTRMLQTCGQVQVWMLNNHLTGSGRGNQPFGAFCCVSVWKNQTWNQRWCYSFYTNGFLHHSIQTAPGAWWEWGPEPDVGPWRMEPGACLGMLLAALKMPAEKQRWSTVKKTV